jgi:hypothetical protein
MRLSIVFAALMIALLIPASASAEAVATVLIDTNDPGNNGFAGPYASPPLASGRYLITVQGTASYWSVNVWGARNGGNATNVCAGTTEPSPMTATAGVLNGPVGVDAEYIFAYPGPSPTLCPDGTPTRPTPSHGGSLQISTDGGASFRHIEPINRAFNSEHSYQYEVELKESTTVQFRFQDRPTADNYGVFVATIETRP